MHYRCKKMFFICLRRILNVNTLNHIVYKNKYISSIIDNQFMGKLYLFKQLNLKKIHLQQMQKRLIAFEINLLITQNKNIFLYIFLTT